MNVNLDYIGVGVNRVVNALAWGEHGGVAYAAHHMIALYDVESAKVVSTICGHTGMVNCVLWVPHEAIPELAPNQHILLSGSADNTIRCWLVTYGSARAPGPAGRTSPGAIPSWQCLAVLQGHAAPVTSIAVHRLPPPRREADGCGAVAGSSAGASHGPAEPRLLLVSTAGDTDVIVWGCTCAAASLPDSAAAAPAGRDESTTAASTEGAGAEAAAAAGAGAGARTAGTQPVEAAEAAAAAAAAAAALYGQASWREQQRIHVGTKMQTTAALTHLPLDPEWTLLATGGTDRRVTLYLRPPGGAGGAAAGRFLTACVLEGHENWVRGVAFCHVAPTANTAEAEGPGAQQLPQLLLASVSQDRYGRIWKLQPEPLQGQAAAAADATTTTTTTAAPASPSPSPSPSASPSPGAAVGEDPLAVLIQRFAPKPHVDTPNTRYVATCEALLIGHEDWVHSLQWAPPPPPAAVGGSGSGGGGGVHTRATAALLTASMDRTMVVWRYEASSGLWMNEASLGDAGASCLGYFGGVWGPAASAILAHGFTGALHLWRRPSAPAADPPADPPATSSLSYGGPWVPQHALGGHFGAVVDLGWGLDGGCVLSVSEDQTARVHTGTLWLPGGAADVDVDADAGAEEVEVEGGQARAAAAEERQRGVHWCEIARSQVHGHDFRCLAHVAIPPGSDFVYVSGSEEKVLRVFEAPQAFIDTLIALWGGEATQAGRALAAENRRGHGFGAAVAALGLSNKAVDEVDSAAVEGGGRGNAGVGSGMPGGDYTDGPDFVPCAAPQVVREPPLEEHLAQNTLWPETHKLYGHGNDVFCAAASPDGRFLASACKAQTASTATIWVWCCRSWRSVAQLRAHTLTVTQLEWSPSSAFLAAGSRDRTFSIFRRVEPPKEAAATPATTASAAAAGAVAEGTAAPAAYGGGGGGGEPTFELVHRAKAAHGRVIWGVSWSLDERLLATASRDDTVKVWWTGCRTTGAPTLAATLPQFSCAATAVAFAPRQASAVQTARGLPDTDAMAAVAGAGSEAEPYRQLLAVGLEDGSVQLWHLSAASATEAAAAAGDGPGGGGPPSSYGLVATRLWVAGDAWRHVAAVRRLRWRGAPGTASAVGGGEGGLRGEEDYADAAGAGGAGWLEALQLASGSEDHSVRVFTFRGV